MALPSKARATLERLEQFGIHLDLQRSRELAARLGDPQAQFPAVLVAGTNGKGSTAALLAAMASAAGYRTGLYTSPHLEEVEERLRLDGRAIQGERLGELILEVGATAQEELGMPVTYFEALTLAAFLYFAREGVDLAVLEVGMGGRLDATNLADPILSLVTSISLDHTEFLGETLAEVAREKAGIFRPGRPALAWVESPEALGALRAAAERVGAPLRQVPERVSLEGTVARQRQEQMVRLRTPRRRYELELSLAGEHQARNLALAVAAAESLAELGWSRLDAGAIGRGAGGCRWPGRLEWVGLPGGSWILLDAAHNPAGVEALSRYLDSLSRPMDLLFGVLADKDVGGMLPPLARRARRVVLTTPPGRRGLPAAALRGLVPAGKGVEVEPKAESALNRALADVPDILLVCGSIYLVGEVRKILRQQFGVPPPAMEIVTGPAP